MSLLHSVFGAARVDPTPTPVWYEAIRHQLRLAPPDEEDVREAVRLGDERVMALVLSSPALSPSKKKRLATEGLLELGTNVLGLTRISSVFHQLIEAGADVNCKNKQGKTLLESLAPQLGRTEAKEARIGISYRGGLKNMGAGHRLRQIWEVLESHGANTELAESARVDAKSSAVLKPTSVCRQGTGRPRQSRHAALVFRFR